MNILDEGLKEKGALMLVPSTAVESMGLGGMLWRGGHSPHEVESGRRNVSVWSAELEFGFTLIRM